MNRTPICGEGGALSEVLAGILGQLREHRYPRYRGGVEEDLRSAAEEFVERFAGHLRHAEETLFLDLRKGGRESAADLDELEKDHRLLGLYARDLATQIRGQDREAAYGVARSFLAVLLDHLHRERVGVRRSLEFMRGDGPCSSEF